MGMREKLIELLYEAEDKCNYADCGQCEYIGLDACGFRMIANHLIANDVVPVVRCKDCKHYIPLDNECEEPHNHYTEEGFREVHDNDFCSYGERKDNERKTD